MIKGRDILLPLFVDILKNLNDLERLILFKPQDSQELPKKIRNKGEETKGKKIRGERTKGHKYWNKRLKGFKILTLFDYAFGMTGFIYRNLWFSANGVSLSQLYLLNVLGLFFSLIFQNLNSYFSDKFNKRYPFLLVAILCQSVAMILVATFPSFGMFVFFIFLWNLISSESTRVIIVCDFIDLSKNPNQYKGEYNRSKEFASYRAFGSLGFAVFAPIVGYSIHYINISAGLDPVNGYLGYKFMFIISGVLYLIFSAILTFYLRDYSHLERNGLKEHHISQINSLANRNHSYKNEEKEEVKTIWNIFSNKVFLVILIPQVLFVFATSIGTGVIDIYFKELGADLRFIGWRPFVWAIMELPLFFLSAKINKKKGHNFVILLSVVFYIIRLSIYYFIMDETLIWLEFILLLFNPFGLTWPAITNALNQIMPRQKSFAMTVLSSSKQAFGLVGSLVGSFITAKAINYDIAFSNLFLTALSILIFCALLIVALKKWAKSKRDGRKQKG